jgi:hypothetical protein
MRKFYVAGLAVLLLSITSANLLAQRKAIGPQLIKLQTKSHPVSNSFVESPTATCDTIDYPIDPGWTEGAYYYTQDPDDGFLNGTNVDDDKQKGNVYDLSATSYTYITGMMVDILLANTKNAANTSKQIYFRVYGDQSGAPGTLLGTAQLPFSQLISDYNAVAYTFVNFSSPIALPASKKFYVFVDLTSLSWPTDSLIIASTVTDNNGVGEDVPGKAWEQWSDGTWVSYANDYAFDITYWTFPIVSTSSAGCSLLPVKLLSFNAQRNNKDVTLNWQIADEYNMKGYEVERADNNGSFKTVQSITALNYAKNQSYSVTDRNAFTSAATVQYRLKQIDGDGSVKYSRVIAVKANAVISDISFANPFSGALKMQLNLATSQNISVQVFDMQGKPVVSQLNKMYNASSNSIVLDGTASLKPGMYILKINAGSEQLQYKIIKQ